MAQPLPAARLQVPDPATNRAVQDVYDRLNQLQAVITTQDADITTLKAQVKKLQNP